MSAVEQQRRQLIEDVQALPEDALQEAADLISRLRQKATVLQEGEQEIPKGLKQLPTIAETFDEIRQICIEEIFELDLPPRKDRPNQFVIDDVSF